MPVTRIRLAESVTRPEPAGTEPAEPEPTPAPLDCRGWLPLVAEQAPWYSLVRRKRVGAWFQVGAGAAASQPQDAGE